MSGGLNQLNELSRSPFDKLMKQLAIRLSCQKTTAKSLVIRANALTQNFFRLNYIYTS